jgi:hypothetical protein
MQGVRCEEDMKKISMLVEDIEITLKEEVQMMIERDLRLNTFTGVTILRYEHMKLPGSRKKYKV